MESPADGFDGGGNWFIENISASIDNVYTICYIVYTLQKVGAVMGQTTLNVRMDEDVKRQFDAFCADVGLNASVAVNLFVKTVIRERRIPFEIAMTPNAETRAAIAEAERDLKRGELKRYSDVDQMMEELLA